MGIERLTVLFPTKVSFSNLRLKISCRTVQYKLNAQSLRLFGLHSDVNDAHPAWANRLQNKTTPSEKTCLLVSRCRQCPIERGDSVLCLGSMRDEPIEAWKNESTWYLENRYLKDLNRIDGEPMEFEWRMERFISGE